ncbi:MAG TPA: TrpB-like pyridoxal phosphate-dependent enzyme [Candidatus Bathyarchaeia archaeon]|nr:TrpB-like pyridoxal phosphate-dependent enzyme [Candidatus Bathyarchaeia archaeon]
MQEAVVKRDQIVLSPDDLPGSWYNIVADLPGDFPKPKDPEEGPSRMEFLSKVLLKHCLQQEVSTDKWISIPAAVQDSYRQAGRPRPLYRARRLERFLKTPARLYYKREDLSPTGSHKVNTALAQAYYAAEEGLVGLSTETGAGQWGSALAYATSLQGLKCVIFWVRSVYDWKPDRRALMQLYGGTVYASPSKETSVGRALLEKDPSQPGSLGIAVSEGLEYAEKKPGFAYSLGSVLNHVLIHQSIIGLETMRQFDLLDEKPDMMIGCLGGGSNFGGFILPFAGEVVKGKRECKFLAAQSASAPNLSKGEYRYDYGDHAEKTPLLKMYTLGHQSDMVPIKADGLRYHAAAPFISYLKHLGHVEAVAYPNDERAVFEAARTFVQVEGFLPAPESAYAIRAAIDQALECKRKNQEKVIAFNISGHGFLDLPAYQEKLSF